jgi:hypothetical protein
MIQLLENIYAVDVPDDLLQPEYVTEKSISQIIEGEDGDDELVIRFRERKCGSPIGKIIIPIPPGTWEIVCTSKDATEGQADSIVQHSLWWFPEKHIRYIDYAQPFDTALKQKWDQGFGKATDSLNSLLTLKGCDLKLNWLILKKQ